MLRLLAVRQTGVTRERLQRAAEAKRLRDSGYLNREIAEALGVSRSYASQLCTDPDGTKSRARKDSYRKPCPGYSGPCANMLSGSEGPSQMPRLCQACDEERNHAERHWTRERIIGIFQEFASRVGRSPSVGDIQSVFPSYQGRMSEDRISEAHAVRDGLPYPALVQREFGSWAAALEAASLAPNRAGHPTHRIETISSPTRDLLVKALKQGPKTGHELCALLGSSYLDSPRYALKPLIDAGAVTAEAHHNGTIYRLVGPPPAEGSIVMPRTYKVLSKNRDGWAELADVEALTDVHAIEQAASEPGTYVAVPASVFVPKPLVPKTVLAVEGEPTPMPRVRNRGKQ